MKRSLNELEDEEGKRKKVQFKDPNEEEDQQDLLLNEEEEEEYEERISNNKPEEEKRRNKSEGEHRYSQNELDEIDTEGIEPFNMDEEEKMGNFEEGTFVWTRRDLDQEEDEAWLTQVGTSLAQPKNSNNNQTIERVRERGNVTLWKIVRELQPNENSLSALRRISQIGDKKRFDMLTESCDRLLEEGFVEVYSKTKEDLVNRIRPLLQWEYKVDGVDDDQIHGPYSGKEMQEWRDMDGFFSKEAEDRCLVRLCNSNSGTLKWQNADSIETFLLPPSF